ncbi:kinase-like protein [Rhizodiscina lignyota]|uniref:non-specific serine/threonine protein kinase n=1 Tax=Rhizodiscina lignyota TaxID=1504668 RepID=A0A9P4I4V8_9PEZI|nr:kinase-like protein [Rhizodiscina lignyota]
MTFTTASGYVEETASYSHARHGHDPVGINANEYLEAGPNGYHVINANDSWRDGIDDYPMLRRPNPFPSATTYSIESIIAYGAYGTVAKVKQRGTGMIYARKQIQKLGVDPAILHDEVSLIRQAQHRHVVELVQKYEDSDWYYIVMAPVADCNLQEYMQRVSSNSPIRHLQKRDDPFWAAFAQQRVQLFQWIYCLANTLTDLHERGIRHRDIKPQNILVHGSSILLTDFGISMAHDGLTKVALTTTFGTSRYEPPESLGSATGDTRMRTGRKGDVFSLGCVFFEMLDTASHRIRINELPEIPDNRFASCVENDHFLSQVDCFNESKVDSSLNLAPEARCPNLTKSLLRLVMSSMITSAERRKSASAIVNDIGQLMAGHVAAQPRCCFKRMDTAGESNNMTMMDITDDEGSLDGSDRDEDESELQTEEQTRGRELSSEPPQMTHWGDGATEAAGREEH